MRLRIGTLGLALAAVLLSGCDEAVLGNSNRVQEDFRYSYPLNAGGRIEVENQNGAIEISGWDRDTVEITGTKFARSSDLLRDIRVDVASSPAGVTIRTIRPEFRWSGDLGVRYSIRVPRRSQLARIVSSNGSIRVDGVDGTAYLRTSNGPIETDGLTGSLEAETSNGRVTVSGLSGPARLHTSNGQIDLSLDRIDEVHAATSNGAITLHVPDGVGAQVRARTSNGKIASDLDLTRGSVVSKGNLEASIGGGGPLLDLSTSNGAINLVRR